MREVERVFKALANERRLKIISLLLKEGEMHVSQIAQRINLSFKSASKHLQKLENAELISRKQKSIWGYYNIIYSKENNLKSKLLSILKDHL